MSNKVDSIVSQQESRFSDIFKSYRLPGLNYLTITEDGASKNDYTARFYDEEGVIFLGIEISAASYQEALVMTVKGFLKSCNDETETELYMNNRLLIEYVQSGGKMAYAEEIHEFFKLIHTVQSTYDVKIEFIPANDLICRIAQE